MYMGWKIKVLNDYVDPTTGLLHLTALPGQQMFQGRTVKSLRNLVCVNFPLHVFEKK